MLMNRAIFMCAKDREIRAHFESHIRNRVSWSAFLDEPDHRRIVDELVRSHVQKLMTRPLAHLVQRMNEMTLANRPLDSMSGLDHIEHVNRGAKDSLEIERVFDGALRMSREVGCDHNSCQFAEAGFVRTRL